MSRNYTYEPHRDLIATHNDKRGTTAIVNRSYEYNALGIPTGRTIQRQGTTRQDSFTHNDRSELTAATMGADNYAYDYDNIGNRKTAQEVANEFTYEANALNQYTQITENDTDFVPTYDLDGNQTRIKTTTGIWTATYNALNRPVRFENEAAGIVITADYDYMGRRVFKKVETNGNTTSHLRFLYRGYLQIAAIDMQQEHLPAKWFITWDPTQPVATRPLAIQKDGTWYSAPTRPAAPGSPSQECSGLGVWLLKPHPAYGIDLPKNVTELYGTNGYIVTAYTYSPYGLVTASGSVTQHIQWSSEYADTDLGMVYYNYRHYNPMEGKWNGRDLIDEKRGISEYIYADNAPFSFWDLLGNCFCRKPQYAQEDIAILENKTKQCSKCNEKLPTLVKQYSQDFYQAQKEQFDKKIKCKLSVTCGCTICPSAAGENQPEPERMEGGFRIRSSRIVIKCGKAGMDNTFLHELTHAIDFCKMGEIDTCEKLLLTEFNAYYKADCSKSKDVKDCLKKKAFNSAITQGVCNKLVGGALKQVKPWPDEDQKKLEALREMYASFLEDYVAQLGRV